MLGTKDWRGLPPEEIKDDILKALAEEYRIPVSFLSPPDGPEAAEYYAYIKSLMAGSGA